MAAPRRTPCPAEEGSGPIRLYVGTYTGGASRGIHHLLLDRAAGRFAGAPTLAGEAENPSYLAFRPDGRLLYAVNEVLSLDGNPSGAVSAFAVDRRRGRLTFVGRQPSEGTDPCHLAVDAAGRNVLVANYSSGTVAVLPLTCAGRLRPASSIRRGAGSGPVAGRQEGPHAHMALLDPAGRFALWTDLGSDRVVVDRFDAASGRLLPNDPAGVSLPPGSGPRHLAWHPSGRAAYLVNELSGTVVALRWDAARGALEAFQTVSAREAGASAANTSAGIVVAPGGGFVYASNRGDDDVAVFAVDRASLALSPAGRVPSGGRGPRSLAIDPSGNWLVAANQRSGSVVLFRLDEATGVPARAGPPAAVPDPVCALFAPTAPGA